MVLEISLSPFHYQKYDFYKRAQIHTQIHHQLLKLEGNVRSNDRELLRNGYPV